jgi:hypothetical protein
MPLKINGYWSFKAPIGGNSRHEIVIITDSLSTIMAAESSTPTKIPKHKQLE